MPLEAWLLLSGIILLIIEVIIPGFGIFGISGLFCLTVGLYCLMGGGVVSMLAVAGMYIILALGVFVSLVVSASGKQVEPVRAVGEAE